MINGKNLKDPLGQIVENWIDLNSSHDFETRKKMAAYIEASEAMKVHKLVFNVFEAKQDGVYVLKEEVQFNPNWMAITSPNAQLLSSSFKRILESGIHGFWLNIYTSLAQRYLPSLYNLPKDPARWKLLIQDLKDKRERENMPTFENSLLKSSFYLYLGGICLSLVSLVVELISCRCVRG